MKVVKGKYNDLSESLVKKVPKLKQGEQVTFQMLNGQKNPDPDPDEQKKRPMLYPKMNIPTTDYIKDGDEWKTIVCAASWTKDGEPNPRFFMAGLDMGGLFNGKFTLVGGNKEDEELYEYLMFSNYNINSVLGEDRDITKDPIFKLINLKADAVQTTNKVAILKKAIDLALTMKEAEERELGASLNWNTFKDWDELQGKVADFAREKPEDFLKYYQAPNKSLKSTIKQALDKNIISYDIKSGEVKMGDNLILTVPKEDRKNPILDTFGTWLESAKNSTEVLESIKSQLNP